MNKNKYILLWLLVLFLATPNVTLAYNLGIDVSQWGYVSYSNPTVLGDQNKQEEKKEEKREEKKEVKESVRVERPEKIEVKKEENKTRVMLKKQEKVEQKLTPERVSLKFSASPKNIGTSDALKEREERKNEKVEIQSEIHDDGTVEMQIESRMVKAKIKDGEMELDLKNNNVGASDDNGGKAELIHLPDQAMQKFLDMGITMTPDTLEVGQSGDKFEYTVDTVKMKKLFGLFSRKAKVKLTLDDSTGVVTEEPNPENVIGRIFDLFSI